MEHFAAINPDIFRALQNQPTRELRSIQLPVHANMVRPDVPTVEVTTSKPTFHLFRFNCIPTVTSVVGRGKRTDAFVLKHSSLLFNNYGHLRNLRPSEELEALMSPHRYSIAVDHFAFEWLKLTNILPANLNAIGCFHDNFDELMGTYQFLRQLRPEELQRLRGIFNRSHLRFVDKRRQFRNLNFWEVYEDAFFLPVHLFNCNFWNNVTEENNAHFVILNLRFSNHFLYDKMHEGTLWRFNRHYSGYNLACDDIISFDELTFSDIIAIDVKYNLQEQKKLYTIQNNFIKDCEIIRNFRLEFIQTGTWTCFFTQFLDPSDYLLTIRLVLEQFLQSKASENDLSKVASFNFKTLQDALLYVFETLNDLLYKNGGPTYGHDNRHTFIPVPLQSRDFELPATSRL